MIDKELEAIFKCHELMKDLDDESKLRVFKYLLDRYNLVPTNSAFESKTTENSTMILDEAEEVVNSPEVQIKVNKTKTTKPTKPKGSNKTYSLIPSLNLVSNGNENLKDFYNKYNSKNNFDKNIVILYYLKRVMGEENVGINHLYTCYKHISQKIPNINQSLNDTKSRKGWIDITDKEDLKVTVAGENYIEHEITTNS
jgi:hypothetical protein